MVDVSSTSKDNKFRRERVRLLKALVDQVLSEQDHCNIIDVGGTNGFWHTWRDFFDFRRVSILCVNFDPGHADFGEANPAVVMRQGDARDLSFAADGAYDIAFSNSVIEHVGRWVDMERMADEVRRVAGRYLVQTPYFWFPIEPHARTAFLHWLPESLRYRVLLHRTCGFWRRQDNVRDAVRTIQDASMLDIAQMASLFPDATIHKERFMGLVKSVIAIKGLTA